MKPRDYCCCAIPTINAGIYAALVEQLVLALVVATLAVAAPAIVGSESFTSWPFAIVCYANAAIQMLGFIGVARDNSILFRRYTTLHILTAVAAFAVAGAMIGISAGRHSTAKADCINDFFPTNGTDTATSSLGDTLCNIFPWVDVGTMGGLWILLVISQFYFYTVVSGYVSWQRDPREKYDTADEYSGLAGDIPMASRSDPWDAPRLEERPTMYAGQHGRSGSGASRYDEEPYTDMPTQPADAYTHHATPTPAVPDAHLGPRGYEDPYYNSNAATSVNRPEQYQPHPGQSNEPR